MERAEARDRRLVAMHEAGHVVIADYLGVPRGDPYIRRVANPEPGELTWCGFTPYSAYVDAEALRMVAVAGCIAEAVWTGAASFGPEAMSESDWEMAGGAPSKKLLEAAEEVRDALCRTGPLWPDLLREARRLIEEARPAGR